MPHVANLYKQGKSLAISLPQEMIDELGLVQGDQVSIELIGGRIEISKAEVNYNLATELGRRRASQYRNLLTKLNK